jgi:putative transposase
LSRLCRLFGISRQSVYQAGARFAARRAELEQVKPLVLAIRMRMPRLGTRKLYHLLKDKLRAASIKLGRDALNDYLRSEQLLIRPRKSYTRTTDSKHWLRKHPNRVIDTKIERAEQVFVADITYLKTRERTHYLSLVTDAFSRRIMGYQLSSDLAAENCVKALRMAANRRIRADP